MREEKHPAIENPIAYFKAWRENKFGGDFDPPALAVDEAVAAFSSHKSPAAQNADRLMWLKIANRIGYERFLDAFDEKASELNQLNQLGKHLRNPAASFQKLLNKRFPKPQPEQRGGAGNVKMWKCESVANTNIANGQLGGRSQESAGVKNLGEVI